MFYVLNLLSVATIWILNISSLTIYIRLRADSKDKANMLTGAATKGDEMNNIA